MPHFRQRFPMVLFLWGAFAVLYLSTHSVDVRLDSPVFSVTLLSTLAYIGIRPRWADRAGKLLLSLGMIYVTTAFADLLLRPWVEERMYYRPEERFLRSWPRHSKLFRYKPNVVFTGRVHGDLAAMARRLDLAEPRNIRFETDRFGLRNEGRLTEQPLSLFVLGDSVADGCGLTQSERVSDVLRMQLRPAYNLSSIYVGPWSEYINLQGEWPRLQKGENPRLYWLLFTANDLEDLVAPGTGGGIHWNRGGGFEARIADLRRRSVLSALLLKWNPAVEQNQELVRVGELDGKPVLFYEPYAWEAHRPVEQLKRHPQMRNVHQAIATMGEWARQNQVEVVVLTVPPKEQVYEWLFKSWRPWTSRPSPTSFFLAIQDVCRAAGIRAYDLNPYLVQESKRLYDRSGELLWWRDDTHPNGRGHDAFARFIIELERQRKN
jgi:lysophospholipase L1-like esterase